MVDKSIDMLGVFKKIKKELKATLENTESILSIQNPSKTSTFS